MTELDELIKIKNKILEEIDMQYEQLDDIEVQIEEIEGKEE